MKRKSILDSSALLILLQKEPGFATIKAELESAHRERKVFLLSHINLGEIYYLVKRRSGEAKAREVLVLIAELPVALCPITKEIVLKAADLKADYDLPYIDSICAATALTENASLMTNDKDFKKVEHLICVDWVK